MHMYIRNGWCQKLTALLIAVIYFIVLIFINNSSYIWATLALVFILIITTFTCASNHSPHLLRLRATGTGQANRSDATATEQQSSEDTENQESGTAQQTRIWTTDIPPSYSFVMAADVGPQTPPPSYGSAILLFPTSNVDPSKAVAPSAGAEDVASPPDAPPLPRRFRPLSISTQVSVCSVGSAPQTPQAGAAISYQISLVNGVSDAFADTVSLRTQLFLSRQVSREELANGEEDSGRPNNAIEVHSCHIPIFFVPDNESVSNESVVIPITSDEETRTSESK